MAPGDSPLFDLSDVHDAIPHDALEEARKLSATVSHLPPGERAAAVRGRLEPDAQKQLESFIDRVGQLPPALRATVAVRMGAYASDDVDGSTGGPASRVVVSDPSMQTVNGKFVIRINPTVLLSDQEIVGTFAHEVYETRALSELFDANGRRLTPQQLRPALNEPQGTLHQTAEAHDVHVVRRFFGLE